ncbi:MAG: sigma-70 family RNA polymerase sigma factor [Chloroflexi bacterium]|nr:sigma-70 family RNA polymerase sigma factor [Chloroflexota bacterium]
MEARQEQQLVQASRAGDLGSFNSLVEKYQTQAYNVACRTTGDPALAEDATQEAFISAFRNISQFRGENFRAWLLRIVINSCYDILRRRKREREVSLEVIEENPGSTIPSPEESPERYAMRQELARHIQKGLDALPKDQRSVLVLVDVQGLPYEEAAQALACNVGTVKSRLSRARAAMRAYLSQHKELLPW